MQIKTTMKCHLTPVRIATINKQQVLVRMWRKGNRFALFLGMQIALGNSATASVWKTVWRYLKKLKMDLPFDPAIPLLEIYPNEPQIPVQKNVSSLMFIAVIFIIAKI